MKKLYEKNEVNFALVWIGLYVVAMNIALQFCGGFDDLAGKTVAQMLVPVGCITLLAVLSTAWIIRNNLTEKFGLCPFKGSLKAFLWFVPLIANVLYQPEEWIGPYHTSDGDSTDDVD